MSYLIQGIGTEDYTAQLKNQDTASVVGGAVTLTKTSIGSTHYFTGEPPVNTASGVYWVDYTRVSDSENVGRESYSWDGTKEISPHALLTQVNTRSSHNAASVWAVTARTLTDKANFTLSTASVTAIASSVWNAAARSLTDKANFVISTTSVTAVVTAVWDAATRSLTDKANFTLSPTNITAISTSTWGAAARSLTDKDGFTVSAANITAIATSVWGSAARSLTTFGSLTTDIWAAATRALTEPVNVSQIAGNTVSGVDEFKATGFATPANVSAVIDQGNTSWLTPDLAGLATQSDIGAVIIRGDIAWITGGSELPAAVTEQLGRIEESAWVGSIPVRSSVAVDRTTGVALYTLPGTSTVLLQKQLRDENGDASGTSVFAEELVTIALQDPN